jgi:anti-sigma-K factor RskA
MSDQPRRERLFDYVFGELDPDRRADVERLTAEDASVDDDLRGLQHVAALLSDMPEDAWPEDAHETWAPSTERRRLRVRRLAAAAGAFVLLAVGIAIGAAIEHHDSAPASQTVVLRAIGVQSTGGAAVAHTRAGRLSLDVRGLPTLDGRHFYELWLMNSDSSLVALASFRVRANGTAELEVPLPVSASLFRYLDVSLQSVGGGPRHSGDSVLRGALPRSGGPA